MNIVGGGYALAVEQPSLAIQRNRKHCCKYSLEMAQPTKVHSMSQSMVAATGNYLLSSFIINNRYGISMDVHKATNTPHLYTRAEAMVFLVSYCEDGNDVLAVYETISKAVEHVRGGNGPVIVEVEFIVGSVTQLPMRVFTSTKGRS